MFASGSLRNGSGLHGGGGGGGGESTGSRSKGGSLIHLLVLDHHHLPLFTLLPMPNAGQQLVSGKQKPKAMALYILLNMWRR